MVPRQMSFCLSWVAAALLGALAVLARRQGQEAFLSARLDTAFCAGKVYDICSTCKSGDVVLAAGQMCTEHCTMRGKCAVGTKYSRDRQGTDCRHCSQSDESSKTVANYNPITDSLAPAIAPSSYNGPTSDSLKYLRPGVTLVLHGDVTRLTSMIESGRQRGGHVAMAVLVYDSADLIKAEYALQSAIVSDRDDQNITLTRWCA